MDIPSRCIEGFKLDCSQAQRTPPLAALPMLLVGTVMMSSIVLIAMVSIDIARAGLM